MVDDCDWIGIPTTRMSRPSVSIEELAEGKGFKPGRQTWHAVHFESPASPFEISGPHSQVRLFLERSGQPTESWALYDAVIAPAAVGDGYVVVFQSCKRSVLP